MRSGRSPAIATAPPHVSGLPRRAATREAPASVEPTRKPFQGEHTAHGEPLWKGATAGFVFVFANPILRSILGWSVVVNLAFAGVPVVLIAHATAYGAPASVTGLMITFMGLGMLGGALASPWILKVLRPSRLVYLSALSLPFGLVMMALTPWPIALGVVSGIITATIPPMNAMLGAYMGAVVPDRLQGRVGAATMMSAMGLKPLGPLALGIVFDNFGTMWALCAAAAVAMLAALLTLDRNVRHMPRPEEMAVD
ncbi:MFS transporter [Phytomonospora sp. NPDC050363]|uniref:MFS transporter n=1 Tax=Phytomonospora sp. NPDC050363 TaxID=3155642 RepID=UPI0033E9BD27